jgi:type I restriction enzyme S subunit
MESNIPDSWVEVQLEEILVSLESGSRPKGGVRGIQSGIPSIGGEHLNDAGFFDFSNVKYVPEQFASKMNRGQIMAGDVLIVKDGATTGKTSFVSPSFPFKKAVVNEHVFICRSSERINSRYLFYFLWSKQGKDRILENFKGSAQGGINTTFVSNTLVPIAPLPEQQRIVVKLDALFEKIESNKERLEKIPKILKRFRQSVLAAAVSGKLTEDWRDRNGIVDEWETMKATEACETVASGSTPKGKPFFEKEEIPYLKVYNIVNQQIDFFHKPQYIKRAIHEKQLKRCRVYPNDVIINIVGPPLGKVALMPDTFPEWNINQAIVVFRPKPFLLPKFLYYVLCHGEQIKAIELELRGTAGQSNISLSQCRDFDFPIPSVVEQEEIIKKVEQLLKLSDKLEARYAKAKAMLDKFPQSILAKAFRGELVSQNSEDEPASVLLARIKKEKEKLRQAKTDKKVRKSKEYSLEQHPMKMVAEKKVKYKKA